MSMVSSASPHTYESAVKAGLSSSETGWSLHLQNGMLATQRTEDGTPRERFKGAKSEGVFILDKAPVISIRENLDKADL